MDEKVKDILEAAKNGDFNKFVAFALTETNFAEFLVSRAKDDEGKNCLHFACSGNTEVRF